MDRGEELRQAVDLLLRGDLVGIPTETVYGLAGDAANAQAVAKIFDLKGRPKGHPLIVHIHAASKMEAWARDLPPQAWTLAQTFWPGPLTLIVKRSSRVLDEVTGGQDTVGLRVPSHPLTLALLEDFSKQGSGAVAAPSANRFGKTSPTRAEHVRAEFGEALAMVLDGGACGVGIESTIVDLSGKVGSGQVRILRPGMIEAAAIAQTLGMPVEDLYAQADAVKVAAPGTLSAHYAPKTPLRWVSSAELERIQEQGVAAKVGLLSWRRHNFAGFSPFYAGSDPEHYAQQLYALLREVDQAGLSQLWVETLPPDPRWDAIRDRLNRAIASHS